MSSSVPPSLSTTATTEMAAGSEQSPVPAMSAIPAVNATAAPSDSASAIPSNDATSTPTTSDSAVALQPHAATLEARGAVSAASAISTMGQTLLQGKQTAEPAATDTAAAPSAIPTTVNNSGASADLSSKSATTAAAQSRSDNSVGESSFVSSSVLQQLQLLQQLGQSPTAILNATSAATAAASLAPSLALPAQSQTLAPSSQPASQLSQAQPESLQSAQPPSATAPTKATTTTTTQSPATMTPAQQLQHDLHQLKLHKERLAEARASLTGLGSESLADQTAQTSQKTVDPTPAQVITQPSLTLTAALPETTVTAPEGSSPGNQSTLTSNGSVTSSETSLPTGRGSRAVSGSEKDAQGSAKTTTAEASGVPGGAGQIFKATYSGVPVFEMICRGVAVMRRRSDSYLNATQILKVAEFDKPQRTRILEREVQKGEHEKIQGGYGKYQEYESSKSNSPPLAPKHITAAHLRPRKPREPRTPQKVRRAKGKSTAHILPKPGGGYGPDMGAFPGSGTGEGQSMSMHGFGGGEEEGDEFMSTSEAEYDQGEYDDEMPSRADRSMDRSPRSRKKQTGRPGDELFINHLSPGGKSLRSRNREDVDVEMRTRDEPNSPLLRRSTAGQSDSRAKVPDGSNLWQDARHSNDPTQSHYAATLLNFFISDATALPAILTHPPPDLDFNLIIDEEGHTPLHWAVAMARTKIVRLLIQHGADIYRVNNQGQTALMRSVLFTNNFDTKSFPTLLEILQKTIFTIDKNDQTVFHHVAATAGMRGKVHASRYYMECLLEKLSQHPSELASIINVRDAVGDTSLIIAARIGNKKVVRLLLEAGADSKIRNKSGRNADEYLQEHDIQLGPNPSSTGQQPTPLPTGPPASLQSATVSAHHSPQLPFSHHHSNSTGSIPAHMNQSMAQPHFHGPPPSGPHGPSQSMRSITPPPLRHGTFPTGSHPGFPEGTPKNSFNPPPTSPFNNGHPRDNLSAADGAMLGRGGVGSHGSAGSMSDHHLGLSQHSRGQGAIEMGTFGQNSGSSLSAPLGAQRSHSQDRPSQRMIPAVTELFEQLTQSYEKDLYEKEQDLLEARNLLHGFQSEIQDGHRAIDELKSKSMYLGQADEQIRTLQNMIRQEIHLRQRLRLEDLVVQEEARLKQETEQEKAAASASAGSGGILRADAGRCAMLEKEASELREQLTRLQQNRRDQVDEIVQLKSQQGKRRHEYKRLIALCCNVSIDEVDGLLGPLLSTLGNEDGAHQ
ncbi:hypothetical protein BGW38_005214 [Lunasporangiospora selenospora]|uniref:HTH APSES-type domain-containing protein n=1 Tax=Lunasporangiospora selenospora TaxID=979761 RepID=A0A9P6G0D4_9FUNG|nr:hypothetical protein BGW38_005214 [Lunasporangiospora selenospora]